MVIAGTKLLEKEVLAKVKKSVSSTAKCVFCKKRLMEDAFPNEIVATRKKPIRSAKSQ